MWMAKGIMDIRLVGIPKIYTTIYYHGSSPELTKTVWECNDCGKRTFNIYASNSGGSCVKCAIIHTGTRKWKGWNNNVILL